MCVLYVLSIHSFATKCPPACYDAFDMIYALLVYTLSDALSLSLSLSLSASLSDSLSDSLSASLSQVVESAWAVLEAKVAAAGSLDDVISAHNKYLGIMV